MDIPRSEYPRPQFVRKDWLCLNGLWQFEIDAGDSGYDRGLKDRPLAGEIIVPFCPESKLSGVGNADFLNAVWYRREVDIQADWAGRNVLLHFGAVDYDATVWVNGQEVARHRGGYTPIVCDLQGVAQAGRQAVIVVRARDQKWVANKASGKQCPVYANTGCQYTRTTGIWQSVWMEPVPVVRLERPKITPDVANSRFILSQPMSNRRPGTSLRVTLKDGKGVVVRVTAPADRDFTPTVDLPIPAGRRRLWSIEDPFLYDLDMELLDAAGKVIDAATSYAGLRSVTIDGMAVKINGRPVFQRLVLDQGYYPDGIGTAPTDQALIDDIKLSMAAGFNGARLHQKVFEERFLYHADRLGYMVWGEFPDWGINRSVHAPASYVGQWVEAVGRDYSHPSIVGWCPLNETWQKITDAVDALDELTQAMYWATKAIDPTRPVIDASGGAHRIFHADIYDSHDYLQSPDEFKNHMAGLADGKAYVNRNWRDDAVVSLPYAGQPYFVSEFGGISWNLKSAKDQATFGYGQPPKSIEEFYARFEGLCNVLLDDPNMFGYCYTQLTDVFQEQNGVYYFDRSVKFDAERLRKIQQRPAAIELTIDIGNSRLHRVASGDKSAAS